jgi:hypothetical protein
VKAFHRFQLYAGGGLEVPCPVSARGVAGSLAMFRWGFRQLKVPRQLTPVFSTEGVTLGTARQHYYFQTWATTCIIEVNPYG